MDTHKRTNSQISQPVNSGLLPTLRRQLASQTWLPASLFGQKPDDFVGATLRLTGPLGGYVARVVRPHGDGWWQASLIRWTHGPGLDTGDYFVGSVELLTTADIKRALGGTR